MVKDYVDSSISIPNVLCPIPNKIILDEELQSQGGFQGKKGKPGTAEWVIQRLGDSPQKAVEILLAWTHPKRVREMNKKLVEKIRGLTD
jgi:hypothetical protein